MRRFRILFSCLAVLLLFLLLTVLRVPAVSAQACQIELSTDPSVVHFPFVALPHPDGTPTFGELLYANYSSSFNGHNIVVQYRSASEWVYLLNFTANEVGFTVVPAGLNSGWAHLGVNTIRAVGEGSCISAPASFSIQVDQAAIPYDLAVYAIVALAWIAFSFFVVVVGRWTGIRFGLFLAVAAAVYLLLAPFTGQRYDVYFLASSGIRILQRVNPFDPGNPPIYPAVLKWAYPPIYAVYSAISYLIYHVLTGAPIPAVGSLTWPGYLTSTYDVWEAFVPSSLPLLVFLLKLPMIASTLVTGILLQRMTGKRSAAVSWLVNPLIILVSAIWGQLDPISALFAVASVYFYRKDKKYHAHLLASLGAAVKVWPLLLVPLFLVHSLKKKKKDGFKKSIKPLAGLLPPVAVTAGLYAVFGNPLEALFIFVYARGIPTYAGQFTVNGLTWQQLLVAIGSPPVPLFLILGLPLYLLILVYVYRSGDDDIAKWVVVSILVFYLTYNYVNPQYFYWILPFLIFQGRKLATWVFTALPMLYIALAYNIYYFVSPVLLFHEFSIGASVVEQLKLAFFQSPVVFIELSAVLPTLAYLLLLRQELLLPHENTGSGDPQKS